MNVWIAILFYVVNAGPTGIAVSSTELAGGFGTLGDCQTFANTVLTGSTIAQYGPSGSVTSGDLSPLKVVCVQSSGL